MNCEIVNNQIDELSLSDLNNISDELTAHLKQCAACKAQYQAHQTYLQRIQAINTPDLQPAVAAIMLRKAKQQGNKTTTKNVGFLQGFIAASILAISVLGTYNGFFGNNLQFDLVEKKLTNEPFSTEVVLVIYAPEDINDADLELMLPQHIAIAGFENIQQLSWPVDLKQGTNTLELPIRVNRDKSLEQPLSIMATLYHDANERNFEINIDLSQANI